jgi:hypothetical protein
VSALTQRPSWRALGRNHEDVKGSICGLFTADPGHGERFVAEGAGVLDYTKNRRPSRRCARRHFRGDRDSIRPIDADTLVEAADATGGRVVFAKDDHPEGGLGSAVVAALLKAGVRQLRLAHLSVSELPGSGTTAELLAPPALTPRTSHRQPPR